MARGINKAILIGNLGADPETRHTAGGNAVTNIRIATSESWRDRQSGEQQERTEWHRIVMFGKLGEIAGEYLRKGSKVYIEGRIQTRKWQGQDGQDRWTTEVVANEMQMLDSRGGSAPFDDNSNQSQQNYDQPQQNYNGPPSDNGGGLEDDIPF